MRGDWRITLVSPSGTRSIMQPYNLDLSPGPVDWTYYSTHHLFEPSAGQWTVAITDEYAGNIGSVQGLALIVSGTEIIDEDRDGLDDAWETTRLGGLQSGLRDDPDRDGLVNAYEQACGSNPGQAENIPYALDFSPWKRGMARVSWPSSPWFAYELWRGESPGSLSLETNIPGAQFESEWFGYATNANEFFQVHSRPATSGGQ
jgi:hypothetical protein